MKMKIAAQGSMSNQSDKDFSGAQRSHWLLHWRLWLAVILLHLLAISALNATLTLHRFAAKDKQAVTVLILPAETAKVPLPKLPVPAPKTIDTPQTETPPPEATPEPAAANTQVASVPTDKPEITPAAPLADSPTRVVTLNVQNNKTLFPAPVALRYKITKDNDSARAELLWRPAALTNADGARGYELSYEATYFGISIIKQTSAGVLTTTGLSPTRFTEKRRGKSEQATHIEADKQRVIFSNNRPEALWRTGVEDRASFLIQLASLFAGAPQAFTAGQIFALPVASTDELETWTFEVLPSELLTLPVGEVEAIKLVRRPRRAYDTMAEVWLAPSRAYLPVRIRITDSGGVTDSQLSSESPL